MKTINDVTLYELMAEDLDLWIEPNKKFGFDLEIDGDEYAIKLNEKGIHPYAMESFACLCRRFLHCYDRAQKELAA